MIEINKVDNGYVVKDGSQTLVYAHMGTLFRELRKRLLPAEAAGRFQWPPAKPPDPWPISPITDVKPRSKPESARPIKDTLPHFPASTAAPARFTDIMQEMQEATGMSKNTFGRHLEKLIIRGLVEEVQVPGVKGYHRTAAGDVWAAAVTSNHK